MYISATSLLLFYITLTFYCSSAYKYLIYNPKFGRSQVMFMGKMADTLASHGHYVVNYVPDLNHAYNDTGSKVAKVLYRPKTYNSTYNLADFHHTSWTDDAWSYVGVYKLFAELGADFRKSCVEQLRDEELLNKLKAEKFDVGFSEYFDVCGFLLFEKLGIKKTILVYSSAMPQNDQAWFGVPSTPSIIPCMTYGYTVPMPFFDRVKNYILHHYTEQYIIDAYMAEPARAWEDVYGVPFDFKAAMIKSSYIFVNTDEHLDFPQAINHKRVHIGGFGMKKEKITSLNEDLTTITSASSKGFVLVSFGTVSSSYAMPEKNKKAFIEAFKEFPEISFLWKYEQEDDVAKDVKNIYKRKWLPQRTLLNHPKIITFITHTGLNSAMESTNAGVPLVCVPLFGDQMYNSAMLINRGTGVRLNKFNITREAVVEALRKVIYDPSYNKKAKNLSKMIRKKPMDPEDRIVKYSEFAAEFDVAENLDISGKDLHWIQFYCLDVIAFLGFSGLLFLLIFVFLARFLLNFIGKNKVKSE